MKFNDNAEIEVESIEFSERFKSYGYGHDVFYVLTPKRMESLLNLWARYSPVDMAVIYRKSFVTCGLFDRKGTFDIMREGGVTGVDIFDIVTKDIENLKETLDILNSGGSEPSENS